MDMEIKRPTRFSYDNCIVRDRSDSESEVSFSLGLNDNNASAPQTSYHSSSDEDEDSSAAPLKLGPYDCYVLMVGFLRRIDVYLENTTDQDEQKHKLLEYSKITKEALMENYEYFVLSNKTNQLTVPSVSHNGTADNDVIDNIKKTADTTRFSSFKSTSTPLPKSKIGKTRFSQRLQNLANFEKDSETAVASVPHNGATGNDHNDIEETAVTAKRSLSQRAKKISRPVPKATVEKNSSSHSQLTPSDGTTNDIEETAVTARPSSSKRAKQTSTPAPKTKVEKNRSSRGQLTLNGDITNNNECIKDAISRKRSASSSNLRPVPVKKAKYVMQDARMARIQAKLHASMNSFQTTSGSSESEATEEALGKAAKARTKNKHLETGKSGAKYENNGVEPNGEVKRTRRRNNGTINEGLSKSLNTVNSEKNQKHLTGEGISTRTRKKSLPNSFNTTHSKSPQREKTIKSKDLGTVNTEKNQRQLSGEGTSRTRKKGLSKSLNIPDKNSCKKERKLKTKSGTSNTQVVPNDEVNQNQSGDTTGTLNTSRVSMKRKLYSAESWLLTLSETLPY